jgi:hypothetical protein
MNIQEIFLNSPREIKMQSLKDALQQNNIEFFWGLSKILIEAPLNGGGLECEIIEQIHREYLDEFNV